MVLKGEVVAKVEGRGGRVGAFRAPRRGSQVLKAERNAASRAEEELEDEMEEEGGGPDETQQQERASQGAAARVKRERQSASRGRRAGGREEEQDDADGPPPRRRRKARHAAEDEDGSNEMADDDAPREDPALRGEANGEADVEGADEELGNEAAQQMPAVHGPVRGADDFCPGNILSITVKNFMTFTSATVKPSPRLNLLIGPNGTGKSSIVCAIGIGLGGEPRLLGRAGEVADFVQRGKETGMVSIELRGRSVEDRYMVQRRIHINNRSEWFLNGRSAKREEVRALMRELNIQVENLTQFLPQDRVCEFAGLSRERLLEETMKAVGDPQLSKQHQHLVDTRARVITLENEIRVFTDTLDRLKEENAEIERDVQRLEQRQKILDEAELMATKLPWVEYYACEEEYKELEEKVKELADKRDDLQLQVMAVKGPCEQAKKTKGRLAREAENVKNAKAKQEQSREIARRDEEELHQRVKELEREIQEEARRARTRDERLHKAREEVDSLQKELEELPEPSQPRAELEPITQRLQELRSAWGPRDAEKAQLDRQMNKVAGEHGSIEAQLKAISNTRNRRIARANDRNLEEATRWLDAHRVSLRSAVYGPLLAEVNILDPAHHAALEQHVAGHIWKAFVTTDPNDRDFLASAMAKWNLTIINESQDEGLFRAPNAMPVTDQLRALGVTHRLDEVFEAAPVVRHTLVNQSDLFRGFVGTRAAEANIDAIHGLGVKDLTTPENVYFWKSSRYHNSSITDINNVRPSRIFAQDMGLQEEEALRRQLQDKQRQMQQLQEGMGKLREEEKAAERKEADLDAERQNIMSAYQQGKRKRQDLKAKLERRMDTVQALEAEARAESSEGRVKGEISRVLENRFAATLRAHKAQMAMCQLSMDLAPLALAVEEIGQVVSERDREVQRMHKELVELQQGLQRVEQQCKRSEEAMNQARATAKAAIDPDLDEAVCEKFSSFPDTVEDLEALIAAKKREADRILCPNEHVRDDYMKRKAEIEGRVRQLADKSGELAECQGAMERTRRLWLPRLRGLVARINETFAKNFREMATAGEVLLDERGDDFKAYGIRIRVQFRETAQMQDLSAHHQSGGERSVSTILYLVALQELSYCPFRVVDEINQGMDATNERKMFQQLVRATCQDNTPQCFIVTPKLLTGLKYGRRCHIHIVENGPFNDFGKCQGFKEGNRLKNSLVALSQTQVS